MYVCVCMHLPLPPYSRTMHPRETSINKMHHLLVSLITVQWSIVVSPFSRWSGALSSNLVLGAARHYKTNFLQESLDFILSQELENEYIIYIKWNTLTILFNIQIMNMYIKAYVLRIWYYEYDLILITIFFNDFE